MKLYLIVSFFSELLVPFLTIVITTLLVYSLTNEVSIEFYILLITGVIVVTYFVEMLRFWSLNRYTFENSFTKTTSFSIELSNHQLKTDYINIESKARRNVISKAYEAISSNQSGIEMMLKKSPELLINIVGMIIYGTLISFYVPIVLLILVLMSIVNYFLIKRANQYLIKMNGVLNDEYREKFYLSRDSTNPNYGKDIRLYKIGDWFNTLFVTLTKNRRQVTAGVQRKFLLANLSNSIFLVGRDIAGYMILLSLVISNKIDLTTFTFLIGIVTGFSIWLNGFTTSFNLIRTSNIQVNNFRACMDVESQKQLENPRSSTEIKFPITIVFDNVTFTYPEAEQPTLNKLSFTLNTKEKVALVGNNGAGKTTIIKLLCGLYTPDSGTISINGYNINEFEKDDYRTLISIVFQDSEPLSLTIGNNISASTEEDVDYERLWDSIEKAGLSEKINSLEYKEKTYITQIFDKNGIRLSGGETQKLMLARSIYKKAPILILDEPTASLDPIAEEQLYIQYKELVKDSTSLFISHRLSSTRFCDRILFIDKGMIVEEGTHEDLMALGKEYYSVFETQAQYYRESE
jgi:ABC-type multidrug transport system fused ATPase/permease subunit